MAWFTALLPIAHTAFIGVARHSEDFTDLSTLRQMLSPSPLLRDEAMQLASLQLARVMVRTMPVDQLIEVLPSLTAFSSHSSAQCRSAMYDILIWVYNSVHG